MDLGRPSGPVASWCAAQLGAAPSAVVFREGHLSEVWGLRLVDGREVVVKVRPAGLRLAGCFAVQEHLALAGFPCPVPLVPPSLLADGRAASAERLVSGGGQLSRSEVPERLAVLLARLLALAPPVEAVPSLQPPPPWIGWEQGHGRLWPPADDTDEDLNASLGPAWLDDVAKRVQARLGSYEAREVVGHGDWESQNIRWRDGEVLVVHDWDSVAMRPEMVFVGAAAAVCTANGQPEVAATVEESERFLLAYEAARGSPLTAAEREVSWAAGLWVRCFNAKKLSLFDPAGANRFRMEVQERLARTGAG